MPGNHKPGYENPNTIPVMARILRTHRLTLEELAREAGVSLNCYLRGVLAGHLEDLGRLPGGGTSAQDGR